MSITSLALRYAVPAPHIGDYDKYLFIGPHPDDIEIGAGATAAKLVSLGKKVTFLICTDGRFGLENAPKGTTPEELIEIRKKEALASAEVLGVEDVRFLGLCDGGFYDPEELVSGIAKVIGDTKAEVIFAPDPDVKSECHIDHKRVGEAAKRLAFFAPFEEIMKRYGSEKAPVEALALYMTANTNRFVNTKGFFELQNKALFGCHTSQFPEGSPDAKSLAQYLKLRSADLGVRTLSGAAEGFRVLGKAQMHCIPEADRF